MSLSPTRAFKIKHLGFNILSLPQHSLLSEKDYIEHIKTAIKNCSLKDSLDEVSVNGTNIIEVKKVKKVKKNISIWNYLKKWF
mmetsp:Transcript_25851/g.22910  ORF Transcript_25851/g.22910 Transcript_25851/m.22910 type:complete len:83 (-) Transcript_25851:8-256(-)